ncbi:E3 ubiquitin-protein ligase RNF181-like [Momordica charantia]|uniref:E3 ubiquitin-protein ligase RNF181-like n=1 Tax=Momordica charantia TaxID=3673 RepID=A0A6J1DBR5_MOMCH|nr:E3 ubiquitin-protein ligase RNF181-like [Momordica charantia]
MSSSTSFSVRYCLHGHRSVVSSGDQPHQVLQVRLRSQSRMISRSPAAILQETSWTPMANAVFPLPLSALNGLLFLEAYIRQLLCSLDLPEGACEVIARKIASFVVELAGGNSDQVNLHVVALVDYIEEMAIVAEEAPAGAAKSAISRLKKEKVEEEVELGDCSVCLNEMNGGSEVIKMPCGHVYHESCILSWLNKNNSCPLCRTKLEQ